MNPGAEQTYTAAVVTFRRPDSLRKVLDSLTSQQLPPTLIVVADNDPDRSAEAAAREVTAPCRVIYLPLAENTGPAGGWAAAVAAARTEADRGDFVAVFDDDDPITDTDVMKELVVELGDHPPNVGAIGLRGATIGRWTGLLRRVPEGVAERASADYLASNGAPLYRWSVIDDRGFFDRDLFFGFEDLDLGLRLRSSGYLICVSSIPTRQVVLDTAPDRTPWREYYKTRALVTIARRHLGLTALAVTIARSFLAGVVRFARPSQQRHLLIARIRGIADGLRGMLGPRGYNPSSNPAKAAGR